VHGARAALGAGLLAVLASVAVHGAGDEVLIYRGAYAYLVPSPVARLMLELAPRGEWRHFPDQTRRIDTDGDGRDDYLAIALGSRGGYGMQLRYRLRYPEGAQRPLLGRWYWCIIIDPAGRKVFERFNP